MKNLRSRGDTIVEVLIVLAILGLSFAISTATASRSISQSRNAQEHSEALGVLDTQVSYLRKAVQQQINLTALPSAFCFDYSTGNPQITPIPATASPSNPPSYPGPCRSGNFYTVKMSFVGASPADGYYDIRVQWDGVNSLGSQQEQMFYRVHQLTSQDDSGQDLGSEKPQIHVTAKRIVPTVPFTTNGADPGPDPSPASICNNAGSYPQVNKSGPTVTLTGGGDPAQVKTITDPAGVTYDSVREFSNYTASISYSSSSFQLCSPTSKSVLTAGGVKNLDFLMRPICFKENYTYSYTAYGPPYYHTVTPVYRDETTYWWGDGARRSDQDFLGLGSYFGSEFWSPNINSDGYHFRRGIASTSKPGYYWYIAWEWHLYSSTTTVFDHYEYSDYYGDPYTVTATGQRWRCPT